METGELGDSDVEDAYGREGVFKWMKCIKCAVSSGLWYLCQFGSQEQDQRHPSPDYPVVD
jgi:hypothetical protein